MARMVTCACGAVLMGGDDEELLRQGRKHADEVHADMRMTDEQIRALIGRDARDVSAA